MRAAIGRTKRGKVTPCGSRKASIINVQKQMIAQFKHR